MLWNKKKTVQQQGGAEKEPDFQVLMIGQRRTGKSSVLSAMLKSIDKLTADTGICIEAADPETRVLMQKKLSQLQLIFDIFRLGETFSTLSGEAEGGAYSPPNDETISYRFHMYLNNREDSSKSYMVEFVDIRGEDMMSDLSDRSQTVLEQISRSSVVIVAVDAPALMEVWKENTVMAGITTVSIFPIISGTALRRQMPCFASVLRSRMRQAKRRLNFRRS